MSRTVKNFRASTQLDSGPGKSQPSDGKLNETQLSKLSDLIKRYSGNNAKLAKAAKLAPSTISMILSGARAPSVKVIVRLAKALCPTDRELEEFTGEMLELA